MIRPTLLLSLLLLMAAPAAAHAAPDVEVGIEDERLMLSEPSRTAATVLEWQALGIDVVRIHARWFTVSPGATRTRRPAGFDPSNHRSRGYDWRALDQAVRLVTAAQMKVMLTVTGPPPLWSTRRPRSGRPRAEPDPQAYKRFARAVALRYGKQVDRYLLWNEPNQAGWLQPQSRCRGAKGRGRCEPASPHLYRELVRAAGPEIERVDPGAQVLLGELAPIGVTPRAGGNPIAPLPFLRAFACVDARYRPLRTGPCRGFRPAAADAFGYHPHGVGNSPERPNPDRDEAQVADLPRLQRVLDRLTRAGRIRSPEGRPFDLYLTEFSYQTSPPDRRVGISLGKQAIYQQQAAYLAWKDPRVRNLTQYQWDDEYVTNRGAGAKRFSGWQGGLRFLSARPKPALAGFRNPIVADVARDGRSARLWGQIRAQTTHEVTLSRAPAGEGAFVPVTTLTSDERGQWTLPITIDAAARWVATWTEPDGSTRRSAVVPIGRGEGGRLLTAVP